MLTHQPALSISISFHHPFIRSRRSTHSFAAETMNSANFLMRLVSIVWIAVVLSQCSEKKPSSTEYKPKIDKREAPLVVTQQNIVFFEKGVCLDLSFKNQADVPIIFDNRFGGLSISGVLLGLHQSVDFIESEFYDAVDGFTIHENTPTRLMNPDEAVNITLVIGEDEEALKIGESQQRGEDRVVYLFLALAREDTFVSSEWVGGVVLKNSYFLRSPGPDKVIRQTDCLKFDDGKMFPTIYGDEED